MITMTLLPIVVALLALVPTTLSTTLTMPSPSPPFGVGFLPQVNVAKVQAMFPGQHRRSSLLASLSKHSVAIRSDVASLDLIEALDIACDTRVPVAHTGPMDLLEMYCDSRVPMLSIATMNEREDENLASTLVETQEAALLSPDFVEDPASCPQHEAATVPEVEEEGGDNDGSVLDAVDQIAPKFVVIKISGSALFGDVASKFAADIVNVCRQGFQPIIVHGGGPQINKKLMDLDIAPKFVDGVRVTSKETMNVVEKALWEVNFDLVKYITAAGCKEELRPIGILAKYANIIRAKKLTRSRIAQDTGVVTEVDWGHVGEPVSVDRKALMTLVNMKLATTATIIPVIASIGAGPNGDSYNINADTVAGAIAAAIGAERLILMTDVEGVLDAGKRLIPQITCVVAQAMIKSNVIVGGMIPKVQTAIAAVEQGVKGAMILDGRHYPVLENALIIGETGTLIVA